ncbi:Alcohol dehydrogenase superfamily, zinc-type [Niveomyces insectorum RCEF 264]|uniref:Alcohol dehydrogenase superfamily, zinc-type n=1 Tax=Niveomyces insectorum RCEF 264 TaxID=1081102 RepID=A0A167VPN4_9HYPO|nr:Alcohol dehydrogenase superfamily, zinc-type [Niveomyces insectorum RCEF 264]
MHYAQVQAFGEPPQYLEGPDLPVPAAGQIRVKILAAAVHRLVQMRAAGQHFTARSTPLDPSADAVGVDEATGTVYYIPVLSGALFAEYANIDAAQLVPLPAGADPVTVAALANPVSSAWLALTERVVNVPNNFRVLILGVTGTSGRAAIRVARHFGAATVIGAARNEAALQRLQADKANGIDEYVVLRSPVADTAAAFAALGHVDVVLDYVYGAAAATLLDNLQTGAEQETQYVNIGTIANDETLPLRAQTLRSKRLRLTGSAPGAWSVAAMARQVKGIVEMAATLPKPEDVVPYPLADVTKVWNTDEARKKRLVLLPWGSA